jgi:DNA repair protein RadC
VAHLDKEGFCVHLDHFEGDLTSVAFPKKEIHARIAECGTAGLILAHNHPSGDPKPSTSDCKVTKRMAAIAEDMDCKVFDHIIVTDGPAYTSFRELGLL